MIIVLANILQPLIDVAEGVLKFAHEDLGLSWGWSIVFLTFATRLVILPLSLRQIRSMRALQAHTPQIKEINEKYKDDPQRKQRELMEFYRENKINPLASCFPLLLQLPVFFALYQLLNGKSFEADVTGCSPTLTGDAFSQCVDQNPVSFGFIDNLTETAEMPELAILIVLFIGTQLAAGLVTMATVERSQRILMFALPFIFVPFILSFPAGLVVYWISTNVWTLGQQFLVQRLIPPPEKTSPEAIATAAAAKPPPPPPRKKKKRR
jgi:YidC/Oxa1 family membrane protein insertase